MLAILKRELHNYFTTPIGYLFMGLFLLTAGYFFAAGNLFTGSSYFTGFFGTIMIVYLFTIPILTMRLISEEKKQKTDQLLLTSPVSLPGIVLGKFLAAFTVFMMTLAVTVIYAIIVGVFGDLALWETIGAYLGFIFLGAGYIAVGTFVSAVSENQVTSALISFFALLFILLVDTIAQAAPADQTSGIIFAIILVALTAYYLFSSSKNAPLGIATALLGGVVILVLFFVKADIFSGLIRSTLQWFSINQRYQNFTMGLLSLDALVYYISFTGLFLFLTVRIIEKRRWS